MRSKKDKNVNIFLYIWDLQQQHAALLSEVGRAFALGLQVLQVFHNHILLVDFFRFNTTG